MEKQIIIKLSFIDLNVDNTSGSFSSSVFRKATFTGLGINFLSYCSYKINAIKILHHRAYEFSSHYLNFTEEVEYLRICLFYNNIFFFFFFFERQIFKFLNKIRQSPAELITVERKSIFLSFLYFGQFLSSFELIKKLTKIRSHSYTKIEFNF